MHRHRTLILAVVGALALAALVWYLHARSAANAAAAQAASSAGVGGDLGYGLTAADNSYLDQLEGGSGTAGAGVPVATQAPPLTDGSGVNGSSGPVAYPGGGNGYAPPGTPGNPGKPVAAPVR